MVEELINFDASISINSYSIIVDSVIATKDKNTIMLAINLDQRRIGYIFCGSATYLWTTNDLISQISLITFEEDN